MRTILASLFIIFMTSVAIAAVKRDVIYKSGNWSVYLTTDTFSGSSGCSAKLTRKDGFSILLSRDSVAMSEINGFIGVPGDFVMSSAYKIDNGPVKIPSRSISGSGAFIRDAIDWRGARSISIEYMTRGGKFKDKTIETEKIDAVFEVLLQERCKRS